MGKQILARPTKVLLALVSTIAVFSAVPMVSAQTSSSNNYQVTESFFGTGGELDAASNSYRSKQSAGELAVGAMRSNIYSAQAGFNTNRAQYIAMATLTPTVDVGVLDVGSAKTGSAQFWVKTYLSDGYVVQSYGGPPKNNTATFATSGTLFGSAPGTEQFGINLVDNTSPNVGADPTQAPDDPVNPFGFGEVDPDYDNINQFKYIDGDIIALSTRSSSDTTFTVSYLFNVSPITPGGTYTMTHVLVATSTY